MAELNVEVVAPTYIKTYNSEQDEKLLNEIKNGSNDALEELITKYKNFVKSKAKTYFLIGADKEDIIQEGMIGLFKAIRDFKNDKLVSFRSFAEICITRQIITAIKTATRQKHIPLNSYISLNKNCDDESDITLLDILNNDNLSDPEEAMINKEELKSIEDRMSRILSEFELEVLNLYLNGSSYQEISCQLERHIKSIDNALQRIKRKIEKYLADQQN